MPLHFIVKQGETEKVVDVRKLKKLTLGRDRLNQIKPFSGLLPPS